MEEQSVSWLSREAHQFNLHVFIVETLGAATTARFWSILLKVLAKYKLSAMILYDLVSKIIITYRIVSSKE